MDFHREQFDKLLGKRNVLTVRKKLEELQRYLFFLHFILSCLPLKRRCDERHKMQYLLFLSESASQKSPNCSPNHMEPVRPWNHHSLGVPLNKHTIYFNLSHHVHPERIKYLINTSTSICIFTHSKIILCT